MSSLDTDIWDRLKVVKPMGEMLIARIAFPDLSKNVLAGIDSEGYRHFLIPILSNESALNDNQSRGLTVSCKDLKVKDQGKDLQPSRYIDITCQDVAGHEAFDIIGREIVSSLTSPNISKSEAVSNVLAKWRYFWGRPPVNLLSHEEIIGLFAELWYLNYWILPYTSPITAVSGWRGPYGSRHDFEWPNHSVEVKGTSSTKGRIHWINGIEQLLPPEKGDLHFFSLAVREEGGGLNTLPNLTAICRKSLKNSPEALSKFENTLVLTGYSPMYDEEYNKICLRVVDEALYTVNDVFPRITADKFQNGVPQGVETVRYQINLESKESMIISRTPVNVFKKLD